MTAGKVIDLMAALKASLGKHEQETALRSAAAALGYAIAPAPPPMTPARLRAIAAVQHPDAHDRVALDLLSDWLEQVR